jgi:hypothetical protein
VAFKLTECNAALDIHHLLNMSATIGLSRLSAHEQRLRQQERPRKRLKRPRGGSGAHVAPQVAGGPGGNVGLGIQFHPIAAQVLVDARSGGAAAGHAAELARVSVLDHEGQAELPAPTDPDRPDILDPDQPVVDIHVGADDAPEMPASEAPVVASGDLDVGDWGHGSADGGQPLSPDSDADSESHEPPDAFFLQESIAIMRGRSVLEATASAGTLPLQSTVTNGRLVPSAVQQGIVT